MNRISKKKNAGFTLIEILVYLALFVILLGGAVISAYSLFESGGKNQTKIMVQEEGSFLLSKIAWALTGIQSVSFPSTGTTGSHLSVTKSDIAIGSIDINISGSDITMTRGGTTYTLNNSNVTIKDLVFDHQDQSGVEWVKTSFTLETKTPDGKTVSQNFQITKYIRK